MGLLNWKLFSRLKFFLDVIWVPKKFSWCLSLSSTKRKINFFLGPHVTLSMMEKGAIIIPERKREGATTSFADFSLFIPNIFFCWWRQKLRNKKKRWPCICRGQNWVWWFWRPLKQRTKIVQFTLHHWWNPHISRTYYKLLLSYVG